MERVPGMKPWLTMWSQPRTTIRVLVHNQSAWGTICLATLFALQSLFYYANWASFGLQASSWLIFTGALVLSPLVGGAWLLFVSWVYFFTGRWLKGRASISQLRVALAWSKLPSALNLFLWGFFLSTSDYSFIHDGGGPPSLLVNLLVFSTFCCSLFLLLQALKELQSFSALKSLFNIFLATILSRTALFFLAIFVRYLYLSL